MKYATYSYDRVGQAQYSFISIGKKVIIKTVIFTPTEYEEVLNLGFGDLMADGMIDDTSDSNNGDIALVLATVIKIVKTFLIEQPRYTILFKGSTIGRTKFYYRIIKTYYQEFMPDFMIMALVKKEGKYQAVFFHETVPADIVVFLVKRII